MDAEQDCSPKRLRIEWLHTKMQRDFDSNEDQNTVDDKFQGKQLPNVVNEIKEKGKRIKEQHFSRYSKDDWLHLRPSKQQHRRAVRLLWMSAKPQVCTRHSAQKYAPPPKNQKNQFRIYLNDF